jgi:DNA topoisomerase-1
MKYTDKRSSQIPRAKKAHIPKTTGYFSYEISKRPDNKRQRLIAAKGTSLRTPSGVRVPPAWTEVWLTNDFKSRIQAIGKDSKGRRVYLYSAEYMGKAAAAKFSRLKAFSLVYPSLIKKLGRDMKTSEEALVLYLIAKTGFRIGSNSETKSRIKAFGASTLRCSHVSVDANKISFDFTGKKGIRVSKTLKNDYLASDIAARCGVGEDKNIFKTTDGEIRTYLSSIPHGSGFMVKDFRTYLATLTALRKIKALPAPKNKRELTSYRRVVGETVARILGNSPTIALKSYVSPEVFAIWESGHASLERRPKGKRCSLAREFLDCVHYDRKVPPEEGTDLDPLEQQE